MQKISESYAFDYDYISFSDKSQKTLEIITKLWYNNINRIVAAAWAAIFGDSRENHLAEKEE